MRPFTHGRFVWRAYFADELGDARAFYGRLFGWAFDAKIEDHRPYIVARAGTVPVCAFSTPGSTPGAAGREPHWSSYLSVADVDGAAAIAATTGGRVVIPPAEVHGLARCALVADPQGARLHLIRGASGDPTPRRDAHPLTFGWETLQTTDPAGSADFYGRVAAWHTDAARGRHVFVSESTAVAELRPEPPGTPSRWIPAVSVSDLDAHLRTASSLGGRTVGDDAHLSDGGRRAFVQDPFGAVFGLVEAGA